MCGIVGYIGRESEISTLFYGLKKLEYRGYDSSGLAFFNGKNFKCVKSVGNMDKLKTKLNLSEKFSCGIGHTRWATNGAVILENTHPVISHSGEWILIHNGIIENAEELKQRYKIETLGNTDSEIVANLLEKKIEGSNLEKIRDVCSELKGSWAFLILNRNEENRIYIAKRKSPIYFCDSESGKLISSDPICFPSKEYFSMYDNNIGFIEKDKIVVYDANLKLISPKKYIFKNKEELGNKGKYEHFMLKEIKETPERINKICEKYTEDYLEKIFKKNILSSVKFIKIIGCGSAYHSGLMGAYYFRKNLRSESEAYLASEYKSSRQVINKDDLFIFVSQSGETADTIECLKMVRRRGAKTIVLTNVLESSMAKLSSIVLPIYAGPEIAVASTKAYSCQVAVFYILAKYFKKLLGEEVDFEKEKNKLLVAAERISDLREEEIQNISICCEKVFFLGKGKDYITSLEASLKFKEITYINSQCCPIGELKHGSLAVIDDCSKSIIFLSSKKLGKKVLNGVHEITSRKGKVLVISAFQGLVKSTDKVESYFLNCRGLSSEIMPLVFTVFAQYLAYFNCMARNLNPDQPRNLAKSVTVE